MEICVGSKKIYSGKIISLRVDEVEVSKNGHHTRREVVEHGRAVAILAKDGDGKLLFVRQFRYPLNGELLEIPAGLMEPGEDPLEAASRELREETGYRAQKWTAMPAIWTSPGFCDEKIYVYLAEDLRWDPLNPDDDEDISLLRYTDEEARALLDSTQAQDAKTLMALGWYFAKGKK